MREVRLGLSVLRNALFEVKASVQKIPHMTASAFGELTQLFAAIDRTYADYYRVQLSNVKLLASSSRINPSHRRRFSYLSMQS